MEFPNYLIIGLCFIPQIDIKNYSLDNKDLLIIGIDLAHPQQLSPADKFKLHKNHPEMNNIHPSVVGISANKMENPWGFAGDFFYQQKCSDTVSPARLTKAVSELVLTLKNAKRTPKRVIVFRDGLSEGEQQVASQSEVPAIRQGIKDVYPDLDPKISYIVGTKGRRYLF